ncbi:unnamed protein product [Adineta steineri]|uniref:Ion transport domain-containing protein n=1 Tax=Adineta steineri TaxID=433720 RepID=A0A815FXF7_9BILA|nr:unnamed protein product [Adineta steineri]CAF1589525.1 unnamed protein product [Adineta steineri]
MTTLFDIALYALFYTGIIMRHTMGNTPHLLTAARIIMAIDLELWYLRSLKFMISHSYLGPKLLMIKTMTRDLITFLYIIFVFITAYGVVSRAMIMHNKIDFSLYSIFSEILYPPYSFLFGGSDKVLEEMSENKNGTYIAEITATHVLLAMHMLFISVLMLNLLIAVFGFTINNVQDNTTFHWQYQRYQLICEYFEKPLFSYPPLIILPHMWFLVTRMFYAITKSRNYYRSNYGDGGFQQMKEKVFKIIPKNKTLMNYRWDYFEHEATKTYARSLLQNGFVVNSSPTIDTIHDDIQQLRSVVEQLRTSSMKKL